MRLTLLLSWLSSCDVSRFDVDSAPCRLVTTYKGPATLLI
ncbi:MAG: DUF1826 domain-containing protein [Halieaceae bacterium]|nr:DUF1826 domain-containing protein [Halieaceae bacterium]MCP4465706.1 DUF1826 domain-containing protein [Halieaceae bacterium]MCP4840858.1 DUF1826 domain-containing protein [Halieaceae bacterium]